jgi:hypothetical protein
MCLRRLLTPSLEECRHSLQTKRMIAEASIRRTSIAMALAGAALLPSLASGQAVLRGVIRDTTGKGVGGVDVILEGTAFRARSDSAGHYLLRARSGDYAALYRALGYHPARETLRLAQGDTVARDIILLVSDAQQLEAVNVKAPTPRGTGLDGFEERRKMGLGSYIDSTQLRREEGRRLGELVRQMRGIKIVPGPRGQLYAVNPIKMDMGGGPSCFASVYLDRILIYRTGDPGGPPDLGRDFQIASLEAIEWYRGSAQVPAEFGIRNSDCGVLVLWTRRGR